MRRFNAITTNARIADRQDRTDVAVVRGNVGMHRSPGLRLYGPAAVLRAKLRLKPSHSSSFPRLPGSCQTAQETMACQWRPEIACFASLG